MSVQLQDELERAFGDGPEHRPVEHAIRSGRRALRVRRTLAGAAALVVAGALGTTYALNAPQSPSGGGPDVATSPSPAPTEDEVASGPSAFDQPVELRRGELVVAPDAEVHQRVDEPLGPGPSTMPGFRSVAVDVTFRGQRQWFLLQVDDSGAISAGEDDLTGAGGFEAWVDDQVRQYWWQFVVDFGPGQTLVPARAGVEILEQRGGVDLPKQFAQGAQRSAIAVVRFDGERRVVMAWRLFDQETGTLSNQIRPGEIGWSLEQHLQAAYEVYGGPR